MTGKMCKEVDAGVYFYCNFCAGCCRLYSVPPFNLNIAKAAPCAPKSIYL